MPRFRPLCLPQALKKLAGYVIGDGTAANSKASYVRQLAPLHGPIVRDHSTELIREYNEWTDKQIAVRSCEIAVMDGTSCGHPDPTLPLSISP